MPPGVTVPTQLPFLTEICWQIEDIHQLTPLEMLRCYERGWHYRSAPLTSAEQAFVDRLAQQYGSWLNGLFTQQLHQKILSILGQLKASFLSDCHIYFGGGTLLTLLHGEYRLSKDINFLCASQAGYRQLRRAVFDQGYQALFEDLTELSFPREIQTNQYGVRFPVVIADTTIRFEIVSEGRIAFESPQRPGWCPVACLSSMDLVTEKLLANSDRWSDRSMFSRDLIDLCVMRLDQKLPAAAIAKAEAAYDVVEPLRRAILAFQQAPDYRDRCYGALGIAEPPRVVDGLDHLAADFGWALTARTAGEQNA